MKTVYLDYASTAPRNPLVIHAREEFELSHYANVWRGLYTLAEEALEHYHNSKKRVAQWIGCEPIEVLYTYSATYAMNILALAIEQNGIIAKWDTILLSLSEHHANIVPWQLIAKRLWVHIKFIRLDEHFQIDMEHLKSLLDDTVKIVSLQYASNVTGAVHPLEKVRGIIGKDRLFFIDATQMATHGPMNMRWLSADAMVFSGHKMMADTGIGVLALWKVLQKAWDAPIGGGGAINFVSETTHEQAGIPEKWEPGTPHITGAVSLWAAINVLSDRDEDARTKHQKLIEYTNTCWQSFAPDKVKVFHSDASNALGIWSFYIPDKHGNDIAEALSEHGICVRSGHHCCGPLHTSWGTAGTVRISIGYHTTQEEIDFFFSKLRELI